MTNNKNSIRVEIDTYRDGEKRLIEYFFEQREPGERPMALDVLLQAQAKKVPDLAFRFGCRARNCGVCTIDINGRPRIACRTRVREGDRLSPMATLPILSDLVVRRDGVARQLKNRLSTSTRANELNVEAPETYHQLTKCIECYACLNNCPMHARNFSVDTTTVTTKSLPHPSQGYRWGNPFTLLKLERIRIDPLTRETERDNALNIAIDLGLDSCASCPGCKCGVGINLKGKVIKPLLKAATERGWATTDNLKKIQKINRENC